MIRRTLTRMAENAAKRLKTDAVTIGTHNGHFHADEALAVHMLRTHVPTYGGAGLVRTRDPALLAECHTVVDVGGEYSPEANRYDHHQRTFDTTFPGRPTKLSSAGLVYMHFGRDIIARRLGDGANDAHVDLLYRKIYENFIEALDAHDNGISVYDSSSLKSAGVEPRFSAGGFTLGAMVGRLNPNWNDPVAGDREAVQRAEDERFEAASARIGEEFDRDLDYYARAWLPARAVVETAFRQREKHDAEGRILVLEGTSCPWKDHLYALEEEAGEAGRVVYVLYPENPTPDAKWRIQCVPVEKDSFQSRKPLPEAWRGVRDQQLDEVAGLQPGAVFVHASGFIGGHKTFEGVLQMAKKALET
jgi:uncharacterized UPF0160 family protein